MAGNVLGGRKAANTNKSKYGVDFYGQIGRKGGKISRGGGFAYDKVGADGLTGRQRAVEAGRLGGTVSRKRSTAHLHEAQELRATVQANPEYLKNVSPVAKIRNLFNR
jgi:general stress protein YciG